MQAVIMNPVLSVLPADLIRSISEIVLEDDVVEYISFRAVCSNWRLNTAGPPVGLDSCFRPRRWIMLSEGDDANLDTSRRRFLNLSTGCCLMRHLPQLDTFSVFSDADGLLFLIDPSSRDVRVLNPFTGHLAHLPKLPDYYYYGTNMDASFMRTFSSSSISTGSCPTVMLFDKSLPAIYHAKPGDFSWDIKYIRVCPNSMLCFRDQFYFAHLRRGIERYNLQKKSFEPVISLKYIDCGIFNSCYVAEFNQDMLLLHKKDDFLFSVYRVDLESKGLVPMSNNRDLAIFLGQRCYALSLNDKLRSLKPNSVYYCNAEPYSYICSITVYKMDDQEGVVLHRGYNLMSPPIGPLTLAQYLAAYCLYSY